MTSNGSGTLSVRATADRELVAAAPSIANRVLVDDLLEAGWVADGPTTNADESVTLTLSHTFANAEDLTTLLNSIGPPLRSPVVTRSLTTDAVGRVTRADNTISGQLGLENGFADFSDAELVTALGGDPFADELSGLSPEDVLSFDLTIALPDSTSDSGERIETWSVPLDGSFTEINLTTSQTTSNPTTTTEVISRVLGVALIVWIILAGSFITFVIIARRRRATQRVAD